METNIQSTPKVIIPIEEIPEMIYNIRLSLQDRERLSQGEYTGLIENIELPEGKTKDAKIRLYKGKDGKLKTQFDFKQEALIIPDRLGEYQLSNEDKNKLNKGEKIGPIEYKGETYFIKVDHELNKIILETPYQIGIPNQIGDYKLTKEDMSILSQGETLPSRVYKGESNYFIANVKMNKDNKGFIFSDIKTLSNQEAYKLIEKLNKTKLSQNSSQIQEVMNSININKQDIKEQRFDIDKCEKINIQNEKGEFNVYKETDTNKLYLTPIVDTQVKTEISQEITKDQLEKIQQSPTKDLEMRSMYFNKVQDLAKNNDFTTIINIKKAGYSLSENDIKVLKSSNLSEDKKVALISAFGEEPNKLIEKADTATTKQVNPLLEEKKKEQEQGKNNENSKVIHTIDRVANSAFGQNV